MKWAVVMFVKYTQYAAWNVQTMVVEQATDRDDAILQSARMVASDQIVRLITAVQYPPSTEWKRSVMNSPIQPPFRLSLMCRLYGFMPHRPCSGTTDTFPSAPCECWCHELAKELTLRFQR